MNQFIQATYCDDIRHEEGGKLSFIGVYHGFLFTNQFPLRLPKFAIYLTLATPLECPFEEGYIRLYKDEGVLRENALDSKIISKSTEAINDLPEDEIGDRLMVLNAIYTFAPFEIMEPCLLRVRYETDNTTVRGLGLKIDYASSSQG